MNLDDAKVLAELHMQAHGLLQQGWTFRFDKATRRFGQARVHYEPGRGMLKEISLSRSLTLLNAEAKVENTILHEVAHALAGMRAGHGPKWQACALRVGATPKACYDVREDNVRIPYRWVAVCPACGVERLHAMRPFRTARSCGACGPGRYHPEFVLLWKHAPEGMSGVPATL
jgi:predicted SprT family Zn-dependent metalloprotease